MSATLISMTFIVWPKLALASESIKSINLSKNSHEHDLKGLGFIDSQCFHSRTFGIELVWIFDLVASLDENGAQYRQRDTCAPHLCDLPAIFPQPYS